MAKLMQEDASGSVGWKFPRPSAHRVNLAFGRRDWLACVHCGMLDAVSCIFTAQQFSRFSRLATQTATADNSAAESPYVREAFGLGS